MRITNAIIRVKYTHTHTHIRGFLTACPHLSVFDFFLDSIPLQYLPNIPGYVPVYIRYGDEPLEDINPELAEAFGETSAKVLVTRFTVRNSSRRALPIYLE